MSVVDMNADEWTTLKAQHKNRIATIVIPLDITPGVAKGLLSRIDSFFSEIRLDLGELEGEREMIDGIIREWERSKAVGANDVLRKKAATESLQKYPIRDEVTVNLYEVQRDIYKKYVFLRSVVDVLDGKQSRLITASGLLKIEKDLAPHGHID
jgi:hypothetical protein